ncbi:MAG: methyltransferase [Bacteroidetes bacterium]|nr:methyltransferase [Bacteroidota bacterium]MDA0903015.1 methyltransferase [Bacteroidota bacterium]MDA1241775.1 methyltransferase [Bacteroidota bacterium]
MGRSGRRIQVFKQFEIHDDACGMKVGTDALVLGALAGRHHPEQTIKRVLDIGTGSGILALMLAQRFPHALIDAIEVEPEACLQATRNAEASPFTNRIRVHHSALQGWGGGEVFDLVVCNPPFFHNHPKSQDRKRNLARHDDALPLPVLLTRAKSLLAESGVMEVIFPHDRDDEFMEVSHRVGLHVSHRVTVRANASNPPLRTLWSLSLTPSPQHTHILFLESESDDHVWSDDMRQALHPFIQF